MDDKLTALEAAFLHLEGPDTPMHIGSLAVFDGAGWHDRQGRLKLGALRRHISARLTDVPRFRDRPSRPIGMAIRPRWEPDPDFDIARHVRSVRIPPGGGEGEVLSVVEELEMGLLDRDHALWELWFIDGLPGGQVAVMEKVHHSVVDGVGGVDLAMMILDPEPIPPVSRRAHDEGDGPSPRELPAMAASLWDAATAPIRLAGVAVAAAAHPRSAGRAVTALMEGALAASTPAAGEGLTAPGSPINDKVRAGRRYRIVRRSLDDVKKTAHALGGTVNDVVLAAVTSGLQALDGDCGASAGARLRALIPVSARGPDEHGVLGNKVTAMVVPLPTDRTNPIERLRWARDAVGSARHRGEPLLASALLQVADRLPEPAIAGIASLARHQPLFNLVVTNVPGPPMPLFLMGSRMIEMFPIVPLGANLTVSVGILSYAGQLNLGLMADGGHTHEMEAIASGIEKGFDELDDARR